MFIQVLLDVRKTLEESKKIKKPGGESTEVFFKYERLTTFCYLRGLLGHIDDRCTKLLMMGEDDSDHHWGPELRVDPRNPMFVGTSTYLWNDVNGGSTF